MHDVVIIGGGVVGSTIARTLAKYELDVCVVEKGSDVAVGSTKANSGIVHAGYDAKPGTLKAKFNVMGQKLFDRAAEELKFPFKRCGSLVVAFDEDSIDKLYDLKSRGEKNGVYGLRVIDGETLRKMEPNMSEGICGALDVPSGGIVCPYEMTIAYAENAAENGVRFFFNTEVLHVSKRAGYFDINTSGGMLQARVVINAAGIHADEINNMVSENKLEITPRKGEYCVLDKTEGKIVSRTIFQLPTVMGKGVLITPTVDGNLLVGPTSEPIDDKEDVSTSREGLDEVLKKGGLDLKHMPEGKVITSYSGLRPHPSNDDFIIGEAEDAPGFINAAGIESPGLTSAPAIALEIEMVTVSILRPAEKKGYNPRRDAKPHFRHMTDEERELAIKYNPDFGKIICRCETVSKAEIIAALRSPLGIRDLDAIKRRTRAGMGRCQSGFCNMRLLDIVAEELDIPITGVTKFGHNSQLLIEKNKTAFMRGGEVSKT